MDPRLLYFPSHYGPDDALISELKYSNIQTLSNLYTDLHRILTNKPLRTSRHYIFVCIRQVLS